MQLLGKREPDIYGSETLADLESRIGAIAEKRGFDVEFFQSNHEGDIVDKLGAADQNADAVIMKLFYGFFIFLHTIGRFSHSL